MLHNKWHSLLFRSKKGDTHLVSMWKVWIMSVLIITWTCKLLLCTRMTVLSIFLHRNFNSFSAPKMNQIWHDNHLLQANQTTLKHRSVSSEWQFIYYKRKKICPLLGSWRCHHELNWPVTNRLLLESCQIFPTGNRTLIFNSGLLFVFLFCIIVILSLSLLIPGGVQTFYFCFVLEKREFGSGAEHPALQKGLRVKQ